VNLSNEKEAKDKTVKELSQKEKQLLATLKEKQQASLKLHASSTISRTSDSAWPSEVDCPST
jgi:hypothetical protein